MHVAPTTCMWERLHLRRNIANRDTGKYAINAAGTLVRGECWPCAFPMDEDVSIPGIACLKVLLLVCSLHVLEFAPATFTW